MTVTVWVAPAATAELKVQVTVLVAGLKLEAGLVPELEALTNVEPVGKGSVMVKPANGTSPVFLAVTWYCTGVFTANWAAGVTRVLAMVPPVWGVVSVLLTDAVPVTGAPPVTGVPLVDRLLVTTWPAVNGGVL